MINKFLSTTELLKNEAVERKKFISITFKVYKCKKEIASKNTACFTHPQLFLDSVSDQNEPAMGNGALHFLRFFATNYITMKVINIWCVG